MQIGALTDRGMQVTWYAVANTQSYSVSLVGRDGSRQTVNHPAGTAEYTFTGRDFHSAPGSTFVLVGFSCF